MGEILWDKKVGKYDLVDNDYLTPEPHAHDIDIDLEIEVYQIEYGWGYSTWNYGGAYVTRNIQEPVYRGKMKGQVTSANFTIDSTSDMRSSCSLSIILDENSDFIVHANDFIFWQHCWLKITKKYNYINDIDMYPMFDWGDHIGLWNNNGLYRSDPSRSLLGWFVPNSGSFSYNAESREFSLSCTDILSFFTDTRGGHISDMGESWVFPTFELPPMDDTLFENYKNDEKFVQDKNSVSKYNYGLVLEGEKDLSLSDKQTANYLTQLQMSNSDINFVSQLWQEQYETYLKEHPEVSEEDYFYHYNAVTDAMSVSKLLALLTGDYSCLIPIEGIFVHLQNDYKALPYDLEFDGNVTFYDVLKKIIDLYPRQTFYFDTNRRLNFIQTAQAWNEPWDSVDFRAREFMDIVLEEHWNIDLSGVKNYVVVWGRDQSCMGYYYITTYRVMCPKCGYVRDFSGLGDRFNCPRCDEPVEREYLIHDTFCIQHIGAHKEVVYDDNLLTEKECFDAARALVNEKCRASKTLSITLADRYLSMYQWADKGVGRRIEYKSKLTGETDVYTIIKWSNDFESGTVTLELEPYTTCRDEYLPFKGVYALPIPKFEYSLDENGLLTVIMNCGDFTPWSLFKVYITEHNLFEGADYVDFWNWTLDMDFVGETCEIYSEATESEPQKKVFQYQFTKNGTYLLTCQAWSPNIKPSSCPNMEIINVTCFNAKLLTEDGSYLKTEDDDYILYS